MEFALISGHVGPEKKPPTRLERYTFVETLPDYFKYEFYKLIGDKKAG